MSKYRKLMLVVALVAALAMLMTMTSVTFAGGGGAAQDAQETTCVVGYVINHREQPVDGTKFDPQLSVVYLAYPDMAEAPASLAPAAEPVAAAEAMTATVPMTATEVMTAVAAAMRKQLATEAMPFPSVTVNSSGYFEIKDLPAGYWFDFGMPLPPDWEGIVPAAPRDGIAETGWTQLEGHGSKSATWSFKIRRWFDVTVLKWEEMQDGTVQRGEGWTITATPQGDPWAVKKSGKTDASGGVVAAHPWQVADRRDRQERLDPCHARLGLPHPGPVCASWRHRPGGLQEPGAGLLRHHHGGEERPGHRCQRRPGVAGTAGRLAHHPEPP